MTHPMFDATIPVINYIVLAFVLLSVVFIFVRKWDFMESTINSGESSPSQKRQVVFFMSWAVILLAFISVLMKINLPDSIWFGMLGIVCTGIGMTVYEKVSMKKAENNTQPPTEQ